MPTTTTEAPRSLYEKHKETIRKAIDAVHSRTFFAQYPEPPSKSIYGETAAGDGMAAYQKQVGKAYTLLQTTNGSLVAAETSPYTLEDLKISYPVQTNAAAYVGLSSKAFGNWKKTDVHTRAGLLVESLEGIKARFFELAHATMHTTGQAFVMSFQASGPHAADRALEAVAFGVFEQSRFPDKVEWVKPMGKFDVTLIKRFRNVPKGVGLVIGCSTFPVWNSVPGIYADLITGNTVIVKPHPKSVYPLALVVDEIQKVLAANGFDPNIIQLAADLPDAPVTKILTEHPDVRLIDFTGSSFFGNYVESLSNKITFTEKAGVNSVILDSVSDLKRSLGNLAFSVSLYSGQMCTCPQNFFIPKSGIKVNGEPLSYADTVAAFTEAIKGIATHEKMGPGTLGAIQSEQTYNRVKKAAALGGKVLLDSMSVPNPEFPNARMASPLVIEINPDKRELIEQEMFGPILFVIPTENTLESVKLAKSLALEHGAITCSAYTTDDATLDLIEAEMSEAGTPVSFNFSSMFWVNQNAGFSDFHVTGGNPAGNASLTDPEFIRKRFTVVGTRIQA